jgi:transposase
MIAIDPHKASWTTVAVDRQQRSLATIRVKVSANGYRKLRRFARRFPADRWAVEGAKGLGAPLTELLRADGIEVLDVPAKLARKVRMLSTGHGRKSDQADAYSVGVAALTAQRLNATQTDDAIAALAALTEHRDDLVRSRTQTVNRIHALLTQIIAAGHPRGLTADDAAQALRSVRPRTTLGRTLRQLAVELVAELRRLDRRIAAVTEHLSDAVDASGTTMTTVYGVGAVVAVKLLARTGPINRFRSGDAFASLRRRRTDRGVLRRRRPPSPLAGWRPAAELRPPRHRDHPDPARYRRQNQLPGQTCSRETPQGSNAVPQKSAGGRCLPSHAPRYGDLSDHDRLTREEPLDGMRVLVDETGASLAS